MIRKMDAGCNGAVKPNDLASVRRENLIDGGESFPYLYKIVYCHFTFGLAE